MSQTFFQRGNANHLQAYEKLPILTNHQENPSQMTIRYYLTSMRMVIIKTRKVASTMRMWVPVHQWWVCEIVQLLPNRIEVFPKRSLLKNHYLVQQCHAWVFIPKKKNNYNHDLKGTFVLPCTRQCFPQQPRCRNSLDPSTVG